MTAYIQGNLALDERRNGSLPAPKPAKKAAKEKQQSRSLPAGEKLLYLFTVVIFCAVAGLIAWRYAVAFEMNSSIVQMESEIRQLEQENAALQNEVAKLQSPERLIDAGIQLGLTLPSELPELKPSDDSTVAMTSAQ